MAQADAAMQRSFDVAATGGPTVVQMPVPLPLELLLSGREITEPRLSPDGSSVAFVHRWGPNTGISAVAADGRGPERLVTFGPEPAPGRGLGGGCFAWLPSSTGLVHAARDGELWQVESATLRQLTAHERVCRAPFVDDTGAVVAYVVDEAEVWLTEIRTGSARRIDDGRHEFCFDPVIAPDARTVSWLAWSPPDMAWDGAARVDAGWGGGVETLFGASAVDDVVITSYRPTGAAVQQPRFRADGVAMSVEDGSGWMNVHVDGRAPVVDRAEHAGPTWGMGQRSYAVRTDGSLVVARNEAGFGTLSIVGTGGEVTAFVEGFTGAYGQVSVVGDRVAALRSGPTTPPEVIVVDAPTGADGVRVVASSGVGAWRSVDVPDPVALSVEHDGVTLHARRYLAGEGRLLCWVHGGPTDQWQVDFRPRLAYWWSRGWDVLIVDPRGSTGHGRAYQRALNGAWGRLDVDDTAAIIRAVHRSGSTRPESTVIIGGSSGGLTVLGVLADHPDVAAAGVASYPVSDLAALATATHRFEAHYTETLVGPSGSAETGQKLRDLSPIDRADRITAPLLLFHGSDDPVVPIAQSELLAERIRSTGATVDLVVYEGEGHGFRNPDNIRDEYERTERFLASI